MGSTLTTGFIVGVGRAIAGVEGAPGLLVDHRIGIEWLIANGVCNPLTGKLLTDDWAERNLGSDTIAIGAYGPAMERLGLRPLETARQAKEWDLIDPAVRDAMRRAGAKFSEIDVLIHISPTVALPITAHSNSGFNDGLREFHRRYPLRSDCRLYHLQNGCSGFLPALGIARAFLAQGAGKVMLVSSVWGGDYRDVDAEIARSDIGAWICGLLFGDGAAALVLSSGVTGLAPGSPYFEVLEQAQITDPETWIAVVKPHPSGDYICLNPAVAKEAFLTKFEEMSQHLKVRLSDVDRLVIHQPNSAIVQMMNARHGQKIPVAVRDHAARFGNLVNVSALVNLYDCANDTDYPMRQGARLFAFTLGADCGMTYAGATMEHRIA